MTDPGALRRRQTDPSRAAPMSPGADASSRRPAEPHVTMGDIAREAGVSQSTVSRVLNATASSIPISDQTQERVLATARRLGYRPNPLARGLRGASTMLLGVIVRDIVDPFFSGAIEAVTTSATSHGYNVVLGHAHGRADEAILLRSVLETRHVDAILVLGDMGDQPRIVEDLRWRPCPGGRALAGLRIQRPGDASASTTRWASRRRSITSSRSAIGASPSSAAPARRHRGAS